MFSTGRRNEKRTAAARALGVALVLALAAAGAGACEADGEAVAFAEVDARLEPRLADGRLVKLAGVRPAPDGHKEIAAGAAADLSLWLQDAQARVAPLRPQPDRWGRIVARLGLGEGLPPASLALVEAGWARVDPETEDRTCLVRLYAAEARARAAGRGLWAEPALAPLDARRAEAFAGRDGEWVIVEGVVTGHGKGRARSFLNFGGPGAPALSFGARTARALEAAGLAPARLIGRRVRARGIVDLRFGPRLDLARAEALEALAPP